MEGNGQVSVVEVRDLVKRYRKAKMNAVDGVSFAVRRGEVRAIQPAGRRGLLNAALELEVERKWIRLRRQLEGVEKRAHPGERLLAAR